MVGRRTSTWIASIVADCGASGGDDGGGGGGGGGECRDCDGGDSDGSGGGSDHGT